MLYEAYLHDLGLILIAGVVFAWLASYIRMPSIVAFILAGLVLGPVTGLLKMTESLELIAETGIALLLFLVGLELSLAKIRDVGPVALVAGIGQVVFTALIGFGFSMWIGFELMESIFISVGLTFSSTVVVVKLLDQKKELNSLYGRIAVGIFLVQDLVVIVALTFLAGLGSGGGEFDWGRIAGGLVWSFGGMLILLALMLVAARYVLLKPFTWAARQPDMLFIWSLCWCFIVVAAAYVLNLSVEIGAFLAGISLAQLPFSEDLRRRVHPLMNFFLAVFFVSLGIQMEFGPIGANLGAALVLALFVLIGNPFIFMIIISRMGYSERTAFKTSVTVAQISEFSFIFAAMGVSSGLIGHPILGIISLVGIVTISISAYLIIYSDPLYAWCRRVGLLRPFRAGARDPKKDHPPKVRSGHVLVVGMNALGRALVRRLRASGAEVLAIDVDPQKLEGLDADRLIGNVEYPSVLEEAGLDRARLVVSALQIEDTNHLLAYQCRSRGIPCAVHAFDLSVIDDLVDLDVNYLLFPRAEGVRVQNEELARRGFLPS
jgi:Kef-type K+ transport system membrane component KefB